MKKLMRMFPVAVMTILMISSSAWAQEETDSPPVPDEITQPAAAADELAQVNQPGMEDVPVTSAEVTVEETEEEAIEEDTGTLIEPFSVNFGISDTFTAGALVRDEFVARNYNLMVFSFGGGYDIPVDGMSASVSASVSKFLTEEGGSTRQREARFNDIYLGLDYAFYTWELTGINFSSSFALTLPTSEVSRFTNLITALDLGLGMSRSFGGLTLGYNFGFSKNLHTETSVVADLEDFAIDVIARDGGTEQIGEAQVALDTGVLASFSVANSLSMSYRWFTGFTTRIAWTLADTFTYDNGTITLDDQFTSEFARPGRGHSQIMIGSVSASYSFLDHFSAGLAMTTTQLPLTADNDRVRFPFFDLETGNLQNTSFRLSVSAFY